MKAFDCPAILIAVATALLAGLPAAAQTAGSDRRLETSATRAANQDTRIVNGIANGAINHGEAERLNAQQGRIDSAQARLSADGRYSQRDFAKVSARQNHASRSIGRARFNRR